nr:MAG TPA: hypothetical protein [Microviridae sp.]
MSLLLGLKCVRKFGPDTRQGFIVKQLTREYVRVCFLSPNINDLFGDPVRTYCNCAIDNLDIDYISYVDIRTY